MMRLVGSTLALGAPRCPCPCATNGVAAQPTMRKRAPKRHAAQALERDVAADAVVDDVDAAPPVSALTSSRKLRSAAVGALAVDDVVGALRLDDRELVVGAAGRDHRRAEELGDVDRGEPGRARRAVDEHRLAGGEAAARDEAVIGGLVVAEEVARLIERERAGDRRTASAGATAYDAKPPYAW